jgi:hypothetical protein
MLAPVLRLFPKRRFRRYVEVPLGRKRIDLLCVRRGREDEVAAIELKVDDWRMAVWQATHNLQIAERAYVALWHTFVPRAERNRSILEQYGVGLISVTARSAKVVFESRDRVARVSKVHKPDFYRILVDQV